MTRVRHLAAEESGFTLVELMIAMSLLAIVIGPITGSFMIGLLESHATRDRVVDSAGVQAVAAYLVTDIQNSQQVDTASTCVPPEIAGGAVRLAFSWDDVYDGDGDDDSASVAYVDVVDASGQHQLYRAACTSDGQDVKLLVTNLASSSGLTATCDGGGCVAASPEIVSVAITVESDRALEASSYGAVTFSIEGKRKVTS